eukprot:9497345-Heterocapsa_arctica.AAC.1
MFTLSDVDRKTLTTIIKYIPHGTVITFNTLDDLEHDTGNGVDNGRTFHNVSIISLVLSEYLTDNDWNYLVIGNDERALVLNDDTVSVHGVVCLSDAGHCYGTHGASETCFQQIDAGEVREFDTPPHICTIHVAPSAIVFGTRSSLVIATPSLANASISGSSKVFDRILVEACCGDDSVLCRETKASKGCLMIPITEQIDFASQEAA